MSVVGTILWGIIIETFILSPVLHIWCFFHFIHNWSRFNYYRIYFDPDIPASKYIRSQTYFKHPDYRGGDNPGDIGLIKLEYPFERRESNDNPHYEVNIICLPVLPLRLWGTQMAMIAGSGPDGDRVKTGSTRLTIDPEFPKIREDNDFGMMICPVSSLSTIYLEQWIEWWPRSAELRKEVLHNFSRAFSGF